MANQSDKKISANNKTILKKQYLIAVVSVVFYLFVKLVFIRDSIKAKFIYGFIALQIVSLICLLIMRKMAIVEGANPSVKYAGVDFGNSNHIVSYLFDIVFICRFVTFATAFSDFYWWFLIVIPLYAIYKIFDSIILPLIKATRAPAPEQTLSKTQQKKQAKRERIKYN